MRKFFFLFIFTSLVFISSSISAQKDASFFSKAFGVDRGYRIYLPQGYDADTLKEYPVIYYFHGWGGRYKWDNYVPADDPAYPGNGRTEPPFVMEWRNYSQSHEVIIVTWDGYEPNLHPGQFTREGLVYGNCSPYDFPRAHESPVVHWGWDYRMYFRDLVSHIDGSYRTIADRDHRGVTGLSMGGLTALYISGQNKDLVGSVSAFCPADNIPKYGPKGYLSVFPVNEMYRSLKGLPVRLSANDGDWLLANDLQMKRIFEGSGFEPFEFHMADFPDHWTADASEQLDFHMEEFTKNHPKPVDWDHICPAFKSFDQWGYNFTVERSSPALTVLENVSGKHMKIISRKFIPDGPIVLDETINVSTDSIYSPGSGYDLLLYNLTDRHFSNREATASPEGRLEFSLPGGGNIVGISSRDSEPEPDIRVIDKLNRDYQYFEQGKECSLGLRIVNIGKGIAQNISIKAFSSHPYISFADDHLSIPSLGSGEEILLDTSFSFSFSQYKDDYLAGNIRLEVKINDVVADTQKIVFFATPESPLAADGDLIILDGRTVNNVKIFNQGGNRIDTKSITGGSGNGNGIPEKGEEVLVYIRLDKGLAPKDINTFHKTYLLDSEKDPFVSVKNLKYDEKLGQAASTSILTYVSFSDTMPAGYKPELWFRIESLYNNPDVPESRATTYQFRYDYRRAKLTTEDTTVSSNIFKDIIKDKDTRMIGITPNPFWNSVRIQYTLKMAQEVELSIYDMYGKKIRELKSGHENKGTYSVEWDGNNNNNTPCPPGIYYCRLLSDHFFSAKILRL